MLDFVPNIPAFGAFSQDVSQMSLDPAGYKDALNFWVFFAAAHPILQPVLWISEVMHASPGPRIAGLVPFTFVLLNIAVILAMRNYKEIGEGV